MFKNVVNITVVIIALIIIIYVEFKCSAVNYHERNDIDMIREVDVPEYGIDRKVDALGRITIPIEYRKKFYIHEGDEVIIYPTSEGILVKSYCEDGDEFEK